MFTNILDWRPSFNLVELINGRVDKRQTKKANQKRKPSASDDTNIVILS